MTAVEIIRAALSQQGKAMTIEELRAIEGRGDNEAGPFERVQLVELDPGAILAAVGSMDDRVANALRAGCQNAGPGPVFVQTRDVLHVLSLVDA